MKRLTKKLRSRKGETLAEILIAILIIALGAALFAAMYTASLNINRSAREEDEKFHAAVDKLEEMIRSNGSDTHTKGTVHYTEVIDGGTGESNDVHVDIFQQDGMTVYKGADPKAPSSSEGEGNTGGTTP